MMKAAEDATAQLLIVLAAKLERGTDVGPDSEVGLAIRTFQRAIKEEALLDAEDVPAFRVTARDRLAPFIVRRWADLQQAGTHPDSHERTLAEAARQRARDMETWYRENVTEPIPIDRRLEDE